MTDDTNTTITAPEAPSPVGAYSQARRIGPLVRISGQLGLSADDQSIAGQTTVALHNIESILRAGGLQWADVLSLQVYLSSDSLFDEFDTAYSAIVPEPYPARTTISCELAPGALVEIDALAVLN